MDYYDKAVEVIEPWNSRMIKKKKKNSTDSSLHIEVFTVHVFTFP